MGGSVPVARLRLHCRVRVRARARVRVRVRVRVSPRLRSAQCGSWDRFKLRNNCVRTWELGQAA